MSVDAAINMAEKASEERGGVPRRQNKTTSGNCSSIPGPFVENLSILANAEAAQIAKPA